MSEYTKIITNKGLELITSAAFNSGELVVKSIVIGDANGQNYVPTATQTSLINKRQELQISEMIVNSDTSYTFLAQIPQDIDYFIIREIGLIDVNDNLIEIAQIEQETYIQSDNLVQQLTIGIQIDVGQSSTVIVLADTNIETASKKYVQSNFQLLNEKNQANGYCPLDENAKVPLVNIPSSLSNVDLSNLSSTGEAKFANTTLSNITSISSNAQTLLNAIYQAKITGSAGNSSTPCYMSGGSWYSCSGLGSSLRCSSRTTIASTKPDMVIAQGGSGTSGYRVWSSGFKECWGSFDAPTTTTFNYTVTFSMGNYSFSNVPMVLVHVDENGHATGATSNVGLQNIWTSTGCLNGRTTSSFTLCRTTTSLSGKTRYETWYAFGY